MLMIVITCALLTQIIIILTLDFIAVITNPYDRFHLATITDIIFMNILFVFQVLFILGQVHPIFGFDVIVGGVVGVCLM